MGHTDGYGSFPLHYAAKYSTMEGFRVTLEYAIRYYPYQKGVCLLFRKDNDGDTPFQYACRKYGKNKVVDVVEDILTRYHSEGSPLHIVEALMMTSVDENIHLDCSYFLLKRGPDVLVRLLSGSHNNNDDNGSGDGRGGGNPNDVDDHEGHEENDDDDNDEDHEEDDDNNKGDGDIGNS